MKGVCEEGRPNQISPLSLILFLPNIIMCIFRIMHVRKQLLNQTRHKKMSTLQILSIADSITWTFVDIFSQALKCLIPCNGGVYTKSAFSMVISTNFLNYNLMLQKYKSTGVHSKENKGKLYFTLLLLVCLNGLIGCFVVVDVKVVEIAPNVCAGQKGESIALLVWAVMDLAITFMTLYLFYIPFREKVTVVPEVPSRPVVDDENVTDFKSSVTITRHSGVNLPLSNGSSLCRNLALGVTSADLREVIKFNFIGVFVGQASIFALSLCQQFVTDVWIVRNFILPTANFANVLGVFLAFRDHKYCISSFSLFRMKLQKSGPKWLGAPRQAQYQPDTGITGRCHAIKE